MTIEISALTLLLLGHFIGDFVLQSSWMATNKSKDFGALIAHVFVYSLTISVTIAFYFGNIEKTIVFFIITAITHMAIDGITSPINSKLWNHEDKHDFFVMVGFDQFIHYVTLVATVLYLKAI